MKNLYALIIILMAFVSTMKAQVSEQEFQALKAIYNSTGGDNWTNRTGWENINTTATKEDVTKSWYGIEEIVNSHITIFNMNNNNMTGTLPSEIGNLLWLREFVVGSNNISGKIPSEIGTLTELISLSLYSNQIIGPLPVSLKNLKKLEYLSISSNPINTEFPGEILKSLTKLTNLTAHQCKFYGQIPNIFDSLSQLDYLQLENNLLSGELPPSINKLKKITSISLGINQLSGNLPTLDSCKLLINLYLWENKFTGTIPNSYANFPALKYFYLINNNVSGIIPAGMFKPALQRLWIDQNYFTFEGIEPVLSHLNTVSINHYKTTKLFKLTQSSITANNKELLNLNASVLSVNPLGGNNNRYKWFKNNVEVYSGNSPIYSVASASASDAGTYRFEVTNTVVTGFTLKSENITVSVVGSNQPPTNITITPSSVNEDYTGLMGTLSATDPDADDKQTFSLATGNGTNDRDNNKFILSGNQLTLNSPANFETTPTLNILITVNDGNGGIFTKAFEITVNNINEAPVYNGQLTSNTIDENAANGSTALTLLAQDPEGTPVIFSITAGNEDGAFGIDGNKLIVADNSKLNYDVKKQYNLSVRASDGELYTTAILIISLNKINQMPKVENATFNIDENSPIGTEVGSVVATDREGDPLTYSIITGNELSGFTFTGNVLKVSNSEALNFEEHPVFNLNINVSDGISNVQATVTINLNNLVENTANDILTFIVPGMVGDAKIDNVAHTIDVVVRDVDMHSLVATYTLSSQATANPSSGTTFDFSTPQVISTTAAEGNTEQWVITVTMQVGKNDLEKVTIRFFPNPVQNILYLQGTVIGDRITFLSLSGKRVLEIEAVGNKEQIDISRLAPGTYLLTITSNKSTATFKITKQ